MTVQIITGEALTTLRAMPEEEVHCIVTSPPYWRQRDYGHDAQIGMESSPEAYVAALVEVFREARRVLRHDGTCWVNLGDRWAASGHGGGGSYGAVRGDAWSHAEDAHPWRTPPAGYKRKDLVGLPWMLAFALRADGWYLRQCNIWAKPNAMPESVRDRTTLAHEYVFQFSKSETYWYNSRGMRTPPTPQSETRLARALRGDPETSMLSGAPRKGGERMDRKRGHSTPHSGFNSRWDALSVAEQQADGANLRSVWWLSVARSGDGHYATMPDALAEICISAGCPPGGTVLDPFGGAGTTGLVADRLQRHAILIELNSEYAALAARRIRNDGPLFSEVSI